jgi:pyruvate dehydrogenase E1 component
LRRGARPSRAPENFGQTGTIADLYRHYGIDANAIIAAAEAIAPGRPIRYLGAA